MRESCSYGSVGVRGGNEPLYPELSTIDLLLTVDRRLWTIHFRLQIDDFRFTTVRP